MPVVSGTSELRNLVVSGNDGAFAERVRVRFWAGGREDPDRPAIEIEAPLVVHEKQSGNLSGGRSQDWKTDVRAGGGQLHVDPVKYADLDIRPGDDVVALERPGTPAFRVLDIDKRSAVRHIVELGDK